MTVYWMEGFDPQHPPSQIFANLIGSPVNVDGGRGGGRRIELPSESGGGVFDVLDTAGEVWIGWHGTLNTSTSSNKGFIMHVFTDGAETTAAVELLVVEDSQNIGFRFDQPIHTTSTAVREEITVGANTPNPANEYVWQLRLRRGETEGEVAIFRDGEMVAEVTDVAQLADSEGPITGFGSYHARRPSSGGPNLFLNDWWVADENLGDARVVTIVPDADGFHTDGTPSEGSTLFDLLNDSPPDDGTTVTMGADETVTFEMDTSELAAVSALRCAAVMVQPRFSGPSNLDLVARIDGTDHMLGDVEVSSTDKRTSRFISEADPSTTERWTATGLAATEFGMGA